MNNGLEQYASYATAKEAIRGLSPIAAYQWAKSNIWMNVVLLRILPLVSLKTRHAL
ncbi:MAG TPA: hypothetical protein VFD11_10710 [Thiopseudomonas sp.]|nr:hypothetical protein [Thiopseudomonas sp.]